jgi:phosphoglycerol transferase MdoB-like AlkP superfamily enzyme
MKRHFLFLFRFFLEVLVWFVSWKFVFMAYNGFAGRGCNAGDCLAVIWHGLPLDIAAACYVLAPVLVLLLLNLWLRVPRLRSVLLVYYAVVALVCTVVCVADTCLYSFWDYKIDATVFNYLSSPASVTSSVSVGYILAGLGVIIVLSVVFFLNLRRATPRSFDGVAGRSRIVASLLTVVLGGMVFLGIRGGVGRSTANVGMVYFSSNQFLNHSAVNPVFSIFSSMSKTKDFSRMGRFYDEARCDSIYSALHFSAESTGTDTLLNTSRPNILIIIAEGFGGTFVGAMGNTDNVTPNFDALTREGVFFTGCYANSYRTDRGVLSILSGYPAFPTASVMKMPKASRNLPSIAHSLAQNGYHNDFLYGGDINFTNMQSYLRSTGYTSVVGDTEFTPAQRLTHGWGVTDSITFNRLYDMLSRRDAQSSPWHTAFLTLASHEPWGVPYNRIPGDKKANAMAYLDDCIGRFVARIKRTPQWKNLLVVILPDHGIGYPQGLTEASPRRYHIPVLWIGGAVKKARRIESICSQSDIAATLLGQLGIGHSDFRFSRDVLSASYTYPTAYHTFDNGIAFVDSTGATVYDLTSKRTLTDSPVPSARRLDFAKAILQKSYDDLALIESK